MGYEKQAIEKISPLNRVRASLSLVKSAVYPLMDMQAFAYCATYWAKGAHEFSRGTVILRS
jgi:hypothetical protein